jgi:predicted nucleic acid-binding protein
LTRFTEILPCRAARWIAIRLFLDADVLIAAFRGVPELRNRALALLAQPDADFVFSPFLRLEVILKPTFHGNTIELDFYRAYLKAATCYGDLNRIFEIAEREALKHGIQVLDSLHLAAANLARCDAFITLEKPEKPLYRTSLVPVVRLIRDD